MPFVITYYYCNVYQLVFRMCCGWIFEYTCMHCGEWSCIIEVSTDFYITSRDQLSPLQLWQHTTECYFYAFDSLVLKLIVVDFITKIQLESEVRF